MLFRSVGLVARDDWRVESWTEQGSLDECERDFAGWTIDAGLVSLMSSRGIVLHCLPAYRGKEVSA